MSTALQSNQALQVSALVGRKVFAPTHTVQFNGQAIQGSITVTAAAHQLTLDIINQQGWSVGKIDLGDQSARQVDFVWDGKIADGQQVSVGHYTFKATGLVEGKSIPFNTSIVANVDSVTMTQKEKGPVLYTQILLKISGGCHANCQTTSNLSVYSTIY